MHMHIENAYAFYMCICFFICICVFVFAYAFFICICVFQFAYAYKDVICILLEILKCLAIYSKFSWMRYLNKFLFQILYTCVVILILLYNREAYLVSWLVNRITQKLMIGSHWNFDMSFNIVKVRSSLNYSLFGLKNKKDTSKYIEFHLF